MLSELKINNYAIADNLDIEFTSGLSTITGETGAGKSIMIDALALALGGRADSQSIGAQSDKSQIIASFDISANPEAQHWLQNKSLDADGECILRRVLGKDGKSRAFINGMPSPLQDVKELAELLINIHSQHQHQLLLKRENHRLLLDEYCQHGEALQHIKSCFQQWQNLKKQLSNLKKNQGEIAARIDFLRFQLSELEELDLQEGEYAALNEEHRKLANVDQDLVQANEVLALIENDGEFSLNNSLHQIKNILQNLAHKHVSLRPTAESIESAMIQIEESSRDLHNYLAELESDPERLAHVDERLSRIHHLARKHHIKAEALYEFYLAMQTELMSLEHPQDSLEHLQKQCTQFEADYVQAAQALSQIRKASAKKLDNAINARFKELGMDKARIQTHMESVHLEHAKAWGLDEIEFLISTNAGQPAQPLSKIASGGELSRISLAIQVNFAANTKIPCLIFDEVDVGIGGASAEVVGKLLKELAQHGQIICITHLAQVAAQGQQHYKISKLSSEHSSRTQVHMLNKKERIHELARMIGGVEVTRKTHSHAEEMLALAQAV